MLDSSIGTAAALHVYATLPTMPFGCELLGPWVLADTLTQTQLEIKDFEIRLPSGPGLGVDIDPDKLRHFTRAGRSEEHTSELQSLMRISYAVFCLKKKKQYTIYTHTS